MKDIPKEVFISNINWDKEWKDLSDDEVADFLKLHGIHYLNKGNEQTVKEMYEFDQYIIGERGKDKLYLYIG